MANTHPHALMNLVTGVEYHVVADGAALPSPDGTTGFIYKPQTQAVMPNLTGNDGSGTVFSSY